LATKELAVASWHTPSNTSFFTRELLAKNNMTVVHHPPNFSFFPGLKIKEKGRHFDTIDVIEAKLQLLLNTLTGHNFQYAFKEMAEALGMVQTCRKGQL
jgi:hypothetical protein